MTNDRDRAKRVDGHGTAQLCSAQLWGPALRGPASEVNSLGPRASGLLVLHGGWL